MAQNNIAKKGLIVGIVLLFLTIGFSPIINAHENTIPPKLIQINAINDVIKNPKVGLSDNNEEIISYVSAYDIDPPLGRFFVFNKELEIWAWHGDTISIHGFMHRTENNGYRSYFKVQTHHAIIHHFVGVIMPGGLPGFHLYVNGIAFGNIEWD